MSLCDYKHSNSAECGEIIYIYVYIDIPSTHVVGQEALKFHAKIVLQIEALQSSFRLQSGINDIQ